MWNFVWSRCSYSTLLGLNSARLGLTRHSLTQLDLVWLNSAQLILAQLDLAFFGIWTQNDMLHRERDRHSTIFSLSVAKFPAKKCGTPCPFKEIQKRQRPITKNDNSKRFSLKYNNAKQLSHDIIKMCFNSSYFFLWQNNLSETKKDLVVFLSELIDIIKMPLWSF